MSSQKTLSANDLVYGSSRAARELGVSESYLRILGDTKQLRFEKTSSGRRRYRAEDVRRLKAIRAIVRGA